VTEQIINIIFALAVVGVYEWRYRRLMTRVEKLESKNADL
jgi:hypothetical protein